MKKAVFLPMLAIFTIIAVSILGYMFVQNNIKSQNTMVGEKSAQVIKAIITNEKNQFFAEDAAKLAYCDALNKIGEDTGISLDCVVNRYQVFDFSQIIGNSPCNPDNSIDKSFKNYFDTSFKNYLKMNKLDALKYDSELDNGYIINSEPLEITENSPTINIKYNFVANIDEKIDVNLDTFKNLITKIRKYNNCKANIADCNMQTGLIGIKDASDNLIKFEVSKIKNPCTLQIIPIKFAINA